MPGQGAQWCARALAAHHHCFCVLMCRELPPPQFVVLCWRWCSCQGRTRAGRAPLCWCKRVDARRRALWCVLSVSSPLDGRLTGCRQGISRPCQRLRQRCSGSGGWAGGPWSCGARVRHVVDPPRRRPGPSLPSPSRSGSAVGRHGSSSSGVSVQVISGRKAVSSLLPGAGWGPPLPLGRQGLWAFGRPAKSRDPATRLWDVQKLPCGGCL